MPRLLCYFKGHTDYVCYHSITATTKLNWNAVQLQNQDILQNEVNWKDRQDRWIVGEEEVESCMNPCVSLSHVVLIRIQIYIYYIHSLIYFVNVFIWFDMTMQFYILHNLTVSLFIPWHMKFQSLYPIGLIVIKVSILFSKMYGTWATATISGVYSFGERIKVK